MKKNESDQEGTPPLSVAFSHEAIVKRLKSSKVDFSYREPSITPCMIVSGGNEQDFTASGLDLDENF